MIRNDSHTHPFEKTRSLEGMRAFAERALKKKLDSIAFTDHAPMSGFSAGFIRMNELERYISWCEMLKHEYAGRLKIRIGLEVDYHPCRLAEMERILRFYPWEQLNGSIHLHLPPWSEQIEKLDDMERLAFAFEQTLNMVETGFFTAVAHLDFARWVAPDYWPEHHEEILRRIFESMVSHGTVLELNTSGIHKNFRSFLPCRKVWDWSQEYPLKRDYASDAHDPERVADGFELAENWILGHLH